MREGLALCDKLNFRLGFVVSFLWFVSFGHLKEMNAVGRQAPQAMLISISTTTSANN
jgi:hypothetical protein